jgi:cytochrome c-type biogenesis protein CcmH
MRKALFALALVFAWPPPAWAVNPDEVLSDPVMENRAREISRGLRCLVCQNQSIDDSDADLAKDLRIIVRERLTAGDSDAQVVDFVVSRYGDYVLLKPPFKLATQGLWRGPTAIAGGGLIAVLMFFRRRRTGESAVQPAAVLTRPPPLSDEENRRIEELLKDDAP